jgi:signal transduction histidine kinase
VALDLRPPMLDDLGLLPTLNWFLREYAAVLPGVEIDRQISLREDEIPEHLKITMFRIVQEASNNIAKHAGASRVRIALQCSEARLHLLIEDDGCGFEPAGVECSEATGRGLGLLSMRERALHSDGLYSLESAPGKGTCIQVWWPCEASR